MTWEERAACRDMNPDIFFPNSRARDGRDTTNAAPAKAICARCPVRTDCLNYATTEGLHYGVWGGLSESERRDLRTGNPQPEVEAQPPRPRRPNGHGTPGRAQPTARDRARAARLAAPPPTGNNPIRPCTPCCFGKHQKCLGDCTCCAGQGQVAS